MTALLLENLKTKISSYDLVPSRGGCFELSVDGKQLYSKLATGEFPDEMAMLDAVTAVKA